MNRRRLLKSAGALTILSVSGTGAFNVISARRNMSISTADDTDAFLELNPNTLDNSAYATMSDGIVEINITTDGSDGFDGEGVSPFALTEIEEVIEVTNQGTQDVAVFVESSDPSLADLDGDFELFATDPSDETEAQANLRVGTEIKNLQILSPGQSFALGFKIDTTKKDNQELSNLEDDITGLDVIITASAEEVPDQ